MKKIVCIIPARFGSTRFPGKPLALIAGQSLLQRTYENARQADILTEVIIATDDSRIYDHAESFGASVVMTSNRCLNGTERIIEVLKAHPHFQDADAIVNVQGDEPTLPTEAIISLVTLLLNDPEASMSTLITPLQSKEEAEHPSIVKCVIDRNQNALYFSRGLIPAGHQGVFNPSYTYYKHLGAYAYRPELLLKLNELPRTPLQLAEDLEQLQILENGYKIKVALTHQAGIGIDHPEDLPKLEQWLCKQNIFL